jgi:hypothetical protein
MSQYRPEIDNSTRGFWAAAADGRLVAERCADCQEISPYPRGFCPSCWSPRVEEVELSGRAVLYTYSVVRVNPMPPFAGLVPYVAAIVESEEGPRFVTRLVDVDVESVHVGMPLRATFQRVDDGEGLVLFTGA